MAIYLNSFQPISGYPTWERIRRERPDIPPYIDGSCRREPDMENPRPSITALCRKSKFAPKLRVGDIAVYVTKKGAYQGLPITHRRLAGVLLVTDRFASHEEARDWYAGRNLPVPSNCLVEGNAPIPWEWTHQAPSDPGDGAPIATVAEWDAVYRSIKEQYGMVLSCEPLFRDLSRGRMLLDDDFLAVFGRVPNTQSPVNCTAEQLAEILRRADVPITETESWVERSRSLSGVEG